MATSEIEKLERRYAENPHGLTFAPLAEVHRKNGDLARALELLLAGLELHPNYIPASIVLGRCHQDLGDQPSAEAAFAHVLRLDDENVIALKSLADINERLERYGEAESWLRRLVSVDRSNEEAREQLQRVEAAKLSATPNQADAAKQGDEQTDAEAPALSPVLAMIDLSPEPVVPSEEPAASTPDLLPVDIAALESSREAVPAPLPVLAAAEAQPTETAPHPDLVPLAPETEAREPAATLPDLASAAQAEPQPADTSAPAEPQEPSETEETVQPLEGLISAEFQPPLEATGGLGVETSEEVMLGDSGSSEFRVPDASEDFKSLAARLSTPPQTAPVEPEESGATAQEPPSKPPADLEFVVTETMAEKELETTLAQQPPKRQYLARDTNGQSVATFFRALLAARPPSEPGSADRGNTAARTEAAAPTPPGQNGSSIGPGHGEESLPVPPAVPSGEQKADALVSFDDFFSSEPDGSTPLRHGNADPGEDDIDQFQSWLQNLKR